MSLNDDKRNQVVALGQMGWSLRQIQKATGVHRETAAGYLKGARPRSPNWLSLPNADTFLPLCACPERPRWSRAFEQPGPEGVVSRGQDARCRINLLAVEEC